jgi:hypothetical protein
LLAQKFKKRYSSKTMLLTPHTIVGVAIGTSIQNPVAAVPLSIGMHFLGDLVPHWDFFSNTEREERLRGWRPIAVMADLVVAVAIGLTATLYALWVLNNVPLAANIFMCGIGSVLPDALEAPHIYMHKDLKFLGALTKIQKKLQFQAPLPWGLITQILVILVASMLILDSIVL